MKLLKKNQLSISSKIAIYLSLLMAFVMISLSVVTIFQLKDSLTWGESDKGRYLTGMLAARIAGPLQQGDIPALNRQVQEFQAETGVEGIIITDSKGNVLATGGTPQMNGLAEKFGGSGGDGSLISDYNKNQEGVWYFNFARKIETNNGEVLGYLGLSTSVQHLQNRISSMSMYFAITAIIAIIAGIFLAIVITRRILKQPITDLSAATEYISTGDFSRKVKLHQRDELGGLAMSFNMMTGYLSNLFRSISTYTGELTKTCQSLNKEINSTGKTSKRLIASLGDHAHKTKSQITQIQGCADIASDLVERVDQCGKSLQKSATELINVTDIAIDPGEAISNASQDIGRLNESLAEMKETAGLNRDALVEMKKVTELFTHYLDVSRSLSFNMALEVAKIGGQNLSEELKELQKLSDEGLKKSREVFKSIDWVQQTLDDLDSAFDQSISAAEKGINSINTAGQCWSMITSKLVTEKDSLGDIIPVLDENRKYGEQLLEKLDHVIVELEKSLSAFTGSGEDGKKQAELLNDLEGTLRRILRVSNTLNNLCLQFKV